MAKISKKRKDKPHCVCGHPATHWSRYRGRFYPFCLEHLPEQPDELPKPKPFGTKVRYPKAVGLRFELPKRKRSA